MISIVLNLLRFILYSRILSIIFVFYESLKKYSAVLEWSILQCQLRVCRLMTLLSFCVSLLISFIHWNIFMIVVLKSGNSKIAVILVLTLFSFLIQILLVIQVTNDFQLKLGLFVYYVMILWILFQSSVLADFFFFFFFWSLPQLGRLSAALSWYCRTRSPNSLFSHFKTWKGAPCYCWMLLGLQVLTCPLLITPWLGGFIVLCYYSPCGL